MAQLALMSHASLSTPSNKYIQYKRQARMEKGGPNSPAGRPWTLSKGTTGKRLLPHAQFFKIYAECAKQGVAKNADDSEASF